MATVYQHIRLDTNQIFYIGIGKQSNRAYSKQRRNKYWKSIVLKHGYKVEIIKEVNTWEEACKLETQLISKYGRKDKGLGPLVNMTDGGEGSIGMSEESKKSISEKLKVSRLGENNPMYGKRGILNPMYGKKPSTESIQKNRLAHLGKNLREKSIKAKKVLDLSTNTIYNCAKDASESININYSTLIGMLSGHRINKTSLNYL
jgi:predicted GIY-YIG superfamily endonuclease